MHYHFIGIKGSGMASLATIVADRGDEVSGSDIEKYIFTQQPLEVPRQSCEGIHIDIRSGYTWQNDNDRHAFPRNESGGANRLSDW